MILSKMQITNFRSIKGTIELDFDRKVTILLGSNDHGKTNILRAIEHLNEGTEISEEDKNWDAESQPSLSFAFSLVGAEKKEWKTIVDNILAKRQAAQRAREEAKGTGDEINTGNDQSSEPHPKASGTTQAAPATLSVTKKPAPSAKDEEEAPELLLPESALDPSPTQVTLTRKGIGGELQFAEQDLEDLPQEMSAFLKTKKPRVELFRILTGNLQDSVTADKIDTDEYEFLQGVFFYAGIDPRASSNLFVQNDQTVRALDLASKQLNESLSKLWGQGTELTFGLDHKGSTNSIEFLADDPAIKSRKARMSKRSDGVTQFFRVSMVLYARRKKNPANSYIYLFDEPGVLLHPQGQKDLLQVFEQLADENQIAYATHSLFMLNQNFPERHRLIFKEEDGTKVDHKPYRQNWKWATDALGVYLTSNILFSNRVLLVEGDSDPIYLYELFRQLNKLEEIDVDLNALGIMSFYDYQNLRFLLQAFTREGQQTKLFVLTDGDPEGKVLLQKVHVLCKRLNVPTSQLRQGRSIEDYCLFEEEFLGATTIALTNALQAEGKQIPADLDARVRKSWEGRAAIPEKTERRSKSDKEERDERRTAGRWFKELAKELFEDEASKIVLARTYAELCRDLKTLNPNREKVKEGKVLCEEIASKLNLPALKAVKAIEINVSATM